MTSETQQNEDFQDSSQELHDILDADGKRVGARQIIFNGRKLLHPASFLKVGSALRSLPQFKEREDDIWLCAYPKSGTHWTNEIITMLMHGDHCGYSKSKVMLENLSTTEEFNSHPSPRVMNTHIPLNLLPEQIKSSKLVYVIRNPLSVALSWYHHINNLPAYDYGGTPETFIKSFSTQLYSLYGSWFSHVTEFWSASKSQQNILVLFYEEIKQDPQQAVRQLSQFLGLTKTDEQIAKVVEETSLSRMKQVLATQATDENIVGKKQTNVFVRKGETSEWKHHVTQKDYEDFMETFHEQLKQFPDLVSRVQF